MGRMRRYLRRNIRYKGRRGQKTRTCEGVGKQKGESQAWMFLGVHTITGLPDPVTSSVDIMGHTSPPTIETNSFVDLSIHNCILDMDICVCEWVVKFEESTKYTKLLYSLLNSLSLAKKKKKKKQCHSNKSISMKI